MSEKIEFRDNRERLIRERETRTISVAVLCQLEAVIVGFDYFSINRPVLIRAAIRVADMAAGLQGEQQEKAG